MTSTIHLNIKQKLALLGYSSLWLIIIPFTLCHFLVQYLRHKPGYSLLRLSRYGLTSNRKIKKEGILIHCASVGEVVAIQSLVERLLTRTGNQVITITTATTTGADRVKLLFGDRVIHAYLPYDFPFFTSLFIHNIKPRKVLINEMELWPNFCRSCRKANIPIYMVNGRMSNKSKSTYQKFPSLFLPMLNSFNAICAQGQRDYDNYLELGVDPDKLFLTNNIKFDLSFSHTDLVTAEAITNSYAIGHRDILVAGSTHDPEEQILLDAYLPLLKQFPKLLLIIVPRHPQRFEKVHQLLKNQNISVNLMSESRPCDTKTQVLLCDQMGKLRAIYALADIAFVGGSLTERGGHNALEPAAVGIPIVMGPSRYNNPAICSALESAKALRSVENAADITSACHEWLLNPELAKTTGEAGKSVLIQNGGAIDKTLEIISKTQ